MSYVTPIGEEDGFCPKCSSSDTLWIRAKARRVCLSCDFSEDFDSFSQALVGWRVKTQVRPEDVADRANVADNVTNLSESKAGENTRERIEKIIEPVEPGLTRITVPTRYRDEFGQYLLTRKIEQAGPHKTEVWNNVESAYTTFDLLVNPPVAEAIFEEWERGLSSF
jgi:hypothetical protein